MANPAVRRTLNATPSIPLAIMNAIDSFPMGLRQVTHSAATAAKPPTSMMPRQIFGPIVDPRMTNSEGIIDSNTASCTQTSSTAVFWLLEVTSRSRGRPVTRRTIYPNMVIMLAVKNAQTPGANTRTRLPRTISWARRSNSGVSVFRCALVKTSRSYRRAQASCTSLLFLGPLRRANPGQELSAVILHARICARAARPMRPRRLGISSEACVVIPMRSVSRTSAPARQASTVSWSLSARDTHGQSCVCRASSLRQTSRCSTSPAE
ncbi:MAG: hypothetical protein JWN04_1600 [Myxococcaceae bacterium]|nr:hypothetical protein [Myxococcaceae bacterium]